MKNTNNNYIMASNSNYPYNNPTPGGNLFPIVLSGISYSHKESDIISQKTLGEMKNAGFNVVLTGAMSANKMEENLINANAQNMNLIIWNSWLFSQDNQLTGQINKWISKGIKSFAGISMKDEPFYSTLLGKDHYLNAEDKNGNTVSFSFLQAYENIINQLNHYIVFINLWGWAWKDLAQDVIENDPKYNDNTYKDLNPDNLSESEELEIYNTYIDKFQELYKPSLFCFDRYPIKEISNLVFEGIKEPKNEEDEGKIIVDEGYYTDLDIFSNKSQQVNRLFWLYVRGMSYIAFSNSLYRPVVLQQFLSFATFSALAYGAKGICYWTYSMRPNSDDPNSGVSESYISALLDRRDNKTATWYFAKKINEEIQKYREVFLDATLNNVEKINSKSFKFSTSSIGFIAEKGKELLLSQFAYNKIIYLMVTSTSPTDYTNFTININAPTYLITEMTPLTSTGPTNMNLNTGTHNRILPPGGFRIFKCTLKLIQS